MQDSATSYRYSAAPSGLYGGTSAIQMLVPSSAWLCRHYSYPTFFCPLALTSAYSPEVHRLDIGQMLLELSYETHSTFFEYLAH